MQPIRKILVPFDDSPQATEVGAYAANLARACDASLLFLHVDHPLTYALPPGFAALNPAQAAAFQEEFQRAVAHAKATALAAGAPRVETLVERGDPATEILRVARDGAFNLIVMGTHGRKGLARAFIGSVAEQIVRRAPCPVLTVRAAYE